VLACATALCGIGIVALPSGVVSAGFLEEISRRDNAIVLQHVTNEVGRAERRAATAVGGDGDTGSAAADAGRKTPPEALAETAPAALQAAGAEGEAHPATGPAPASPAEGRSPGRAARRAEQPAARGAPATAPGGERRGRGGAEAGRRRGRGGAEADHGLLWATCPHCAHRVSLPAPGGAASAAALLQLYDADDDGSLSREELRSMLLEQVAVLAHPEAHGTPRDDDTSGSGGAAPRWRLACRELCGGTTA